MIDHEHYSINIESRNIIREEQQSEAVFFLTLREKRQVAIVVVTVVFTKLNRRLKLS